MKTFTKIFPLILAMTMAAILSNAQQQIQFEGYYSQGEGLAGWDADGSGPEPAATGHSIPAPGFGNQTYYGSSHDYITGNPDHAAFHFLSGMTGFPLFEQALTDHGFTPEQVKCKYKLATLGDDIEGVDWFFMNDWHYSNYYDGEFLFELDGEPMLSGFFNYLNMYVNTLAGGNWYFETAYTPLTNVAAPQTSAFEIAQAFLDDLNGKEIRTLYQTNSAQSFSGNGRSGVYLNVFNGILETGYPQIPCIGLTADNQGYAAWDADGTGPEPYGNGHGNYAYYAASVDYNDINTNPDACLAHFLEGSTGFFNTLLQLQYRGFNIGDLKIKMGLASFGPDAEGEDWGYINGNHWCNYYNNVFTFEIKGEPILQMMQDTMKLAEVGNQYAITTSVGKVYDISQGTSPEAQFVAKSFLRDLGTHYLEWNITNLSNTGTFSGNGRNGVYYQISEAAITGVHRQATFISAGNVSGNWSAAGSPYYVEGHLSIENGQTLTIEPGVRVGVRGPYHFWVQGCLNAEGKADNPIMFTASNPNIYWDGLDYDGTPATNETSLFDHCIFQYGRAQGGAESNSGGIFAVRDFDNIEIYNSTFRHNLADIVYPSWASAGGAIALWNASPIIQKCVFHNNYAKDYGGAILVYMNSNPVISNCLFYDNHANFGGALSYWQSSGKLINNTIVDNTALHGGGLYFQLNSNPEIINNIIWGNRATGSGKQAYFLGNNIPGFYYNTIEEGSSGFGGNFTGHYLFNIEDDPAFETSPEFPPYMISGESPCIDMGTPDTSAWYYPQYLPETCLYGNPRICGTCIDMGAYEQLSVGIRQVDITGKIALKVSPNPFNTLLNIDFSTDHQAVVTIDVFNAMGEKVDQITKSMFSAGDHTLTWQNPALPKGLYFIRLKTNTGSVTHKVLKY